MPPPDPRHLTPAPPPASPSAGPDIKIPPPTGALPRTQIDLTPSTQPPPNPATLPDLPPLGMSSTQLVIATVLVLAWAGLLVLLKRMLTQSLVAQFADLGRSRAAGTTLYLFLLVLGATLIFCALGGFWQALIIMVPAAVLNAALLALFLVSLNAARASRQRR